MLPAVYLLSGFVFLKDQTAVGIYKVLSLMGGNDYHRFEGYPYCANSEKHTGDKVLISLTVEKHTYIAI